MQAFIIVHGHIHRQGRTVANRYNTDRQRIVLRQAWVGDRRIISRGLGRENNPGARAGIKHKTLTRNTWDAWYVARLNNTRQSRRNPELM